MPDTAKIKFSVPGIYVQNGSYMLRWRKNGKRRAVKLGRVDTTSKSDAEKKALEYRNGERVLPGFVSGDNARNITLLSVFQELRDTVGVVNWKNSTREKNEELVGKMLQEFHDRPVNKITKYDIRQWYYSKRNQSRPTRTDNAYRVLHRVMKHAIRLDLIEQNPCMLGADERYKKRKRTSKLGHETASLGKFVVELAMGAPKQTKKSYQTSRDITLLWLLTGVRKTALASLKWESVDFQNRWLVIEPEFNKKRKGDLTTDIIPMARIVQRMMQSRYRDRELLRKILDGPSPLTYVFPDRYGRTHIKSPEKTISGICERADIPRVSINDLRRTVANFLPEVQDDYVLRQQFTGHKVSDVHVEHYAQGQSIKRRRMIAQDVADFLSRCMYAEGADGILRGTVDLAADNRTEVDERWADENTLDWLLYGTDDEKEMALEKFVWAANGDAISRASDRAHYEEFDLVENGYVIEDRR